MLQPTQVDTLTVTVIVDNETDHISPPCDCCSPPGHGSTASSCCSYTSESLRMVNDMRAGRAMELDYKRTCFAGHGLSLLLEAEAKLEDSMTQHRGLLFDAGPVGQLWQGNAEKLRVDGSRFQAVVLSHWHIDHSGGLLAVAQAAASSDHVHNVVFDLHPKRPSRRGLQLHDHHVIPFNEEPCLSDFEGLDHVEVQLRDKPHTLLDGMFLVSGEVERTTRFEQGNPQHVSLWDARKGWQADPLILDERYVAVDVKGKGLVVFSACSHAGITNVARDAERLTGQRPYCLFGGLHLSPRDCIPRIQPTVEALKALDPALVVAGHCTGWRAKAALVDALPGRFMPCSVGSTYVFKAAAASAEHSTRHHHHHH